jgi:hypothetical protein
VAVAAENRLDARPPDVEKCDERMRSKSSRARAAAAFALTLALPLAFAVEVSGCIVAALEPVIPDSAATFEPGLLGTWRETPGSDIVEIARDGPTGYTLRHTTGDRTIAYRARTGRVGGRRLLEVRPALGDGEPRR